MILNSRKRRQIRQYQVFGQQMLVRVGQQLAESGMDKADVNRYVLKCVAPGSHGLLVGMRWWANVRLVDGFRRAMKRANSE